MLNQELDNKRLSAQSENRTSKAEVSSRQVLLSFVSSFEHNQIMGNKDGGKEGTEAFD